MSNNMGSLMAGWLSRSPVHDRAPLERKKSVTEQGIEEYWRLKKVIEEDHLEAILPKKSLAEEHGLNDLQRTHSLPVDVQAQARALDDNCWWSRSDWAFLNEPPVIAGEVPNYKYAAQYGVASSGSTKPDTDVPIPNSDTKVPPKLDTKAPILKPNTKVLKPKPDTKVPPKSPESGTKVTNAG